MDPIVLANEEERNGIGEVLDFDHNGIEFGADNCATHHICANKSLFVGEMTPLSTVGVRGINGVSLAKGLGTVRFDIKDDDDSH